MDPASLVPLLALLPLDWRNAVLAVLAFLGSMTVAIAALNAVVPTLRALAAKTAMTEDDEALGILSDLLVLAADMVDWCKRVLQIVGAHKPPTAESLRGAGPAALVLLAVLALPSQACAGQDSLRTHSQIASAAYSPIMLAKQVIEERAAHDYAEIHAHYSGPEAADKVALLRESYAPVEGAMSALIATYNAYVDAIQASHATGQPMSHEAALAILSRWASLTRAASLIGLEVPVPPDVLLALGRAS